MQDPRAASTTTAKVSAQQQGEVATQRNQVTASVTSAPSRVTEPGRGQAGQAYGHSQGCKGAGRGQAGQAYGHSRGCKAGQAYGHSQGCKGAGRGQAGQAYGHTQGCKGAGRGQAGQAYGHSHY
ncbi:hypothetical protein NDU88_000583 [Pleurodeles waltl]|uniref:Uncharacterized protein n=1 Tax=Pleurodeles waltl TaxID=8319 RepID=A0AAV7MH99_PLEWA|nr:hypothetical protein NDU88_000583 [Pleurodeles waltl]